VIRQADTEDWKQLRDVRLRALADSPGAFIDTAARASQFPESLWRERATPTDTQGCFLSADSGGMVSCFVADDPANVFLVAMWVAPELRGTGVASELVARVVDWAARRGSARVCLSVEPGNDRAARLYEKCGFVETTEPPPFPYELRANNRFYLFELR
jgi:GNAT superfamily N-acetyltransferase